MSNLQILGRFDSGRHEWTIRHHRFSFRLDRRTALLNLALVMIILLAAGISLGLGDFFVAFPDVVASFFGSASRADTIVVQQWRLGRVLLSLLLGFGLAVSGAIFQTLTRNPLGSPDIIGFTTGAYTGAIVLIALVHAPTIIVSLGALASGLLVAAIVFALSYRGGFRGFRLIIVGIGVSAMLGAFNTWIIATTDLQIAMAAALWGAGSLNAVPADSVLIATVGVSFFVLVALLLGRHTRSLEFGDDAARTLGVRTGQTQLALVVAGVGLVAVATAVAGPISFVALVAPQIASRLTGRGGWQPMTAGMVGALLLLLSDTLARVAFLPFQLPVGILTVCLGGLYLLWLLIHEARKS